MKLYLTGSRASPRDQVPEAHVALARGGSEVQLEWRSPARRRTGAVAWAHWRQSSDDSGNESDGEHSTRCSNVQAPGS